MTQQPIAKRLKRAQLVKKDMYYRQSQCLDLLGKPQFGGVNLCSVQPESRQTREVLFRKSILKHDRCTDFKALILKSQRTAILPTESRERSKRVIVAFLHHEPTWRIREEEHSNSEDDRRHNLNGKGKSPRRVRLAGAASSGHILIWVEGGLGGCAASIRKVRCASGSPDIVGTVVDPVTNQNTDCDRHWAICERNSEIQMRQGTYIVAQLQGRHESLEWKPRFGSAYSRGDPASKNTDLGNVQWHNHCKHADTKSSNSSTCRYTQSAELLYS